MIFRIIYTMPMTIPVCAMSFLVSTSFSFEITRSSDPFSCADLGYLDEECDVNDEVFLGGQSDVVRGSSDVSVDLSTLHGILDLTKFSDSIREYDGAPVVSERDSVMPHTHFPEAEGLPAVQLDTLTPDDLSILLGKLLKSFLPMFMPRRGPPDIDYEIFEGYHAPLVAIRTEIERRRETQICSEMEHGRLPRMPHLHASNKRLRTTFPNVPVAGASFTYIVPDLLHRTAPNVDIRQLPLHRLMYLRMVYHNGYWMGSRDYWPYYQNITTFINTHSHRVFYNQRYMADGVSINPYYQILPDEDPFYGTDCK